MLSGRSFPRHAPASATEIAKAEVFPRRRLSEAGFFNLRALLGLTLCFLGLALAIPALRPAAEQRQRPHHRPVPGDKPREDLTRLKQYWHDRLTYPTGRFDPAWVREAAAQHAHMPVGVPAGVPALLNPQSPLALSTTSFTALGPQPEQMTGCSHCENNNWATTEGRVNDIAVDPTTTVNGSIVAYLATSGGGVWKTTNCCSASTTWRVVTDNQDPVIYTTAIDSLTIDPRDHNKIYAGTGGRRHGKIHLACPLLSVISNDRCPSNVLRSFYTRLPLALDPNRRTVQ